MTTTTTAQWIAAGGTVGGAVAATAAVPVAYLRLRGKLHCGCSIRSSSRPGFVLDRLGERHLPENAADDRADAPQGAGDLARLEGAEEGVESADGAAVDGTSGTSARARARFPAGKRTGAPYEWNTTSR